MKVNIGCGGKPRDGFVNVDQHPLSGVDIVHDLDIYPWPFDDQSVQHVLAEHVYEHVKDPIGFVLECWRVLDSGGLLTVTCPHWTSQNAFTDPTHVRFVTDQTFDYWCAGEHLNVAQGKPFLGDVFRFRKRRIIRNGGDITFRLLKMPCE
jgi:SAM-dependent methyltransferase